MVVGVDVEECPGQRGRNFVKVDELPDGVGADSVEVYGEAGTFVLYEGVFSGDFSLLMSCPICLPAR